MAEGRSARGVGTRLVLGLLVAFLVLAGAELGLRLAFGPPNVPVVIGGPKGGLFTERDGVLMPTQPDVLRTWPVRGAARDEPRLAVLGGSSMVVGEPGARAGERAAAALGMEWINLAMPGADTAHLAAMGPALAHVRPEVALVYAGHNDWGNATFGELYADPRFVRVAQVRQVLGRLQLFGQLEGLLGSRQIRNLPPNQDLRAPPLSPAQSAAVLADYRFRLRRVVEEAEEAGATVFLSTVVSNALFPSARWTCPDEVAAFGVEPSRVEVPDVSGLDRAALDAARAASDCRDLDYIAAVDDYRKGTPGAVETLVALRDTDPLPNRAPAAANAAVREIAAETDAVLIDAAAEAQALGGGMAPPDWFTDGMHLSVEGHGALARIFVAAVAAHQGRPAPALGAPPPPPPRQHPVRNGAAREDGPRPAMGAPPPRDGAPPQEMP